MASQSQSASPSLLRYPLAVLACALVVCVWVPILIGLGWLLFDRLDPWMDRQLWIIRVPLQIVCGLLLLCALGGGWAAVTDMWNRVTQLPSARDEAKKHGRHAKWYPGRDPNADQPGEGAGEHGRCPKCEFSFGWNGTHCSHCGYNKRA